MNAKPCPKKANLFKALSLAVFGLASSSAALAQGAPAADKWQFELAVYGWFPAITSDTQFPPTGAGGPTISASAEDVIDSLNMGFMAQAEARKGKWGIWTDLVYSNMSGSQVDSKDFSVGNVAVTGTANLGLKIKTSVWTTSGLYNLSTSQSNRTDLLFGARMLKLKETLTWSGTTNIPQLPSQTGETSVSATEWDAILGFKGQFFFGEGKKWFVPYYADIGTGNSELTWQINAGLGYKFGWGAMVASYRYLGYEFSSSSPIKNMSMSGPLLGAAWQF